MDIRETQYLHKEIAQLQHYVIQLEEALQFCSKHCEAIEEELQQTNLQLRTEVSRRQQAEGYLKMLTDKLSLSTGNQDIELIIGAIIELGEAAEREWSARLAQTEQLAFTDSLTQIANRRKFDSFLEEQWTKMQEQHKNISLLLCDIDYFKHYNDTYGHPAGDMCLKQVAYAIKTVLRSSYDLAARYGGEEFAVVLPNSDIHIAIQIAQRVQTTVLRLAIPHSASPVADYVTLSIGAYSVVPNDLLTIEQFIASTDRMLYTAKRQGRNRIAHEPLTCYLPRPDPRRDNLLQAGAGGNTETANYYFGAGL